MMYAIIYLFEIQFLFRNFVPHDDCQDSGVWRLVFTHGDFQVQFTVSQNFNVIQVDFSHTVEPRDRHVT